MIFPKVQFVARGRSPRATKHRGKNEHSLQKYIYYFFHGREFTVGRKCSTSVTMLTSEKLISTPDREKISFFKL
jgi:hypothetical protein